MMIGKQCVRRIFLQHSWEHSEIKPKYYLRGKREVDRNHPRI